MPKYLVITESALDAALVADGFTADSMVPETDCGVHEYSLSDDLVGYRVLTEPPAPLLALVGVEWLLRLSKEGASPNEVYRRIARVIKGLKAPPIHLPRQWYEYHHRNLLAFFALPRDISSCRWIAEINGDARCVRFDCLTFGDAELDLASFSPRGWPREFEEAIANLLSKEIEEEQSCTFDAIAQQVDLRTIGSNSIVSGFTYEEWLHFLNTSQKAVLAKDLDASIRIVGPAGSGKTLSLCMRALQLSRDPNIRAQGKRLLVATHSWAMSERIDGVLSTLNGGLNPEGITVFPLLSLLELHAGSIGQKKTDVIGNDSTDGRLKSIEIISEVLSKLDSEKHPEVDTWIKEALQAPQDSRQRLELTINLYDEISGVLTASGVTTDDQESIQKYLSEQREDWMPPFDSVADRGFVTAIYKSFIEELIDREAITTDQFILDSIRILETFTWRMRKETEGYDFVFVDELQIFDPQERSALELLGRAKKGVPFVTAEDPAQGVFSALNSRHANVANLPVYLEVVHRFNKQIFDFISFIYQQFPLNALPLQIDDKRGAGKAQPTIYSCSREEVAISKAAAIVHDVHQNAGPDDRICVVTLGDVDAAIAHELTLRGLYVTRLESFDDVERLAYVKKSVVVAPWQFIGGTQFTHVVVLALQIEKPNSQFGRLREMIAVYLSCSRATETLDLMCAGYTPAVIVKAMEAGLLFQKSGS